MTPPSRALRSSLLVFALASFGTVATAQTPMHERLTRIAHAYTTSFGRMPGVVANANGASAREASHAHRGAPPAHASTWSPAIPPAPR